ncbi:MAG TPA: arylamine N-acetyltransferase [Chondromyces sp.]|nr:arylamine N-acetyltransferase [Chondromyces sp.]
MDSVSRYLMMLKMKREHPSLNYLQRLIQHHLLLVPYETFSKFYYYVYGPSFIPEFQDFVRNLEEKGWGGTCFTLNINFARLLKQLGYECHFVRVLPGHVAIMVQVEGRRFYVDVGYGSPIMRPIELEAKAKHVLHGFGEEIIFTHQNEQEFYITRRANGKTFVQKKIEWQPLQEGDLREDIENSFFDDENNTTMRRITAVRFQGNQSYFLRNETLKVMTYRNIRERRFGQMEQWKKVVSDTFHLESGDLEESVEFLSERGIFLFK